MCIYLREGEIEKGSVVSVEVILSTTSCKYRDSELMLRYLRIQ